MKQELECLKIVCVWILSKCSNPYLTTLVTHTTHRCSKMKQLKSKFKAVILSAHMIWSLNIHYLTISLFVHHFPDFVLIIHDNRAFGLLWSCNDASTVTVVVVSPGVVMSSMVPPAAVVGAAVVPAVGGVPPHVHHGDAAAHAREVLRLIHWTKLTDDGLDGVVFTSVDVVYFSGRKHLVA